MSDLLTIVIELLIQGTLIRLRQMTIVGATHIGHRHHARRRTTAGRRFRKNLPRFAKENRANNNALVEKFAASAREKNATPAQLALAWVLAQGDDMLPIPGTKRTKYLQENASAVNLALTPADLKAIDALAKQYPVAGERYLEASLKMVER